MSKDAFRFLESLPEGNYSATSSLVLSTGTTFPFLYPRMGRRRRYTNLLRSDAAAARRNKTPVNDGLRDLFEDL